MAASAKLRDWRDDLIEGTPLPVDVVDSLLAVVEAAERGVEYAMEPDAGKAAAVLRREVAAALSALNEVLK